MPYTKYVQMFRSFHTKKGFKMTTAAPVRVFEFTSVPDRTRTAGVGGGGRKSARLDAVRALAEGTGASVPVVQKDGEDFLKAAGRTQSGFYRPGALPFRPTIRMNKTEGTVEIYRPTGSTFAVDESGNPITKTVIRGGKTSTRNLTVAEVAAAKNA